jgi:predicted nucleotidyltransferase
VRAPFGNQVHYRANPACVIYEELRGILRKTFGIADVLRESLEPVSDQVDMAFVYGSVAKGEERAASDVDVMIVGKLKFGDAVQALTPAGAALRREVNPHVYSMREFRRKLADGEPFLLRVAEGPKLYLKGSDDDLKAVTRKGRDA